MTRINTVLVGVDGSANAAEALAWAATFAQQIGASLMVVHAVGLTEPSLDADGDESRVPAHGVIDDVRELLDTTWTEPARAAGVPLTTLLEDGPPTMALPRVAEREGADIIVVGHRGIGAATGVLGSTSHRLLEATEIPVTCVPLQG